MNVPRYKLVGVHGVSDAPAEPAGRIVRVIYRPPTIILKRSNRREYYVVHTPSWYECYLAQGHTTPTPLGEIAEITLHQTAERFDTLEQALLYFNAVAV